MLVSLLLSCLFFGLISMILPSDRRNEWIHLLLVSLLILSACNHVLTFDFPSEFPEEIVPEITEVFPESAALHSAVSSQVLSLTGSAPLSVESDLRHNGNEYQLTWIRVEIQDGNEKEVQDALQTVFSFEGFTVRKIQGDRSGEDLDLFSKKQVDDSD